MKGTANTHAFRRTLRRLLLLPALLLLLAALNLFLQSVAAHMEPYYSPSYSRQEIVPLLEKSSRTQADYETLFFQTGLSPAAVEDLLRRGESGKARILETQSGVFSDLTPQCTTLLFGRFTCEDCLLDEDGKALHAVPLAPLELGDIILTFSTHTVGWHHGHASLVVDADRGITLEAIHLGSDSCTVYASHWTSYSNFMVLRVKDATDQERLQVALYALEHLDGVPYSLLSGIFGPKAPDPSDGLVTQCAYLPWYAWQEFGVDLDSDGGKLVTVLDLAESPALEVVQVYGMDPSPLVDRLAWPQS